MSVMNNTRIIEQVDKICDAIREGGGGGGGGSTVTVTPILTSGEHIADITVNSNLFELYAPSGGGGSSSHTYSENEQIVGSWLDGKPVYEISINGFSWGGGLTLIKECSNIDKIIEDNGSCVRGSGEIDPPGYGSYISFTAFNESSGFTPGFYVIGSGISGTINATIRYTKTTD